jgi:hypothetical protein
MLETDLVRTDLFPSRPPLLHIIYSIRHTPLVSFKDAAKGRLFVLVGV